jgi:TRAP-type mannitol/chloroaromatic compound transport system substrate-binding protein
MDRRSFLTQSGAVAGVAAGFPAPAIAQGNRELKLVTSWPKGLPGLGASAERLGRAITTITGGRIKVQVFGAGELVSAFEVFDAVSSGVADMWAPRKISPAADLCESRS